MGLIAALLGCSSSGTGDGQPTGPSAADGLANLKDLYSQAAKGEVAIPGSLAEFSALEPFYPVAGPFVLGRQIECDWGAGLKPGPEAGRHRLAYEKNAGDHGGFVLFQDGTIRKVTADEFKSIPKAVP